MLLEELIELVPFFLVEEMHEVLEAFALGSRDRLTEETGDALYLWVFFLQVLEAEGRIRLDEAIAQIESKLTRRHPHVFGNVDAETRREALGHWERQKREELPEQGQILRRLPASLPALIKARRLQEKAAAFGFDWEDPDGVIRKVREEIDELAVALKEDPQSPNVREEFGDILFAVVSLARHLHQDPEVTLANATEKFRTRFNTMARMVEEAGHRMGETPLDVLESHWQAVKPGPPTGNPPSDQR